MPEKPMSEFKQPPLTEHEEEIVRLLAKPGSSPAKALATIDAARSELAGLRAAIREGALMANVVTGDGADALPVRMVSSLTALWQRATEERDAERSRASRAEALLGEARDECLETANQVVLHRGTTTHTRMPARRVDDLRALAARIDDALGRKGEQGGRE